MFKIKSLESFGWRYDGNRYTVIIDSWDGIGREVEDKPKRIYHRFDVFNNLTSKGIMQWKAMSASLDIGPINVDSAKDGKALCEKWHHDYWTKVIDSVKSIILE